VNKPVGERARGRTSQVANEPRGEKARGQTNKEAKNPDTISS